MGHKSKYQSTKDQFGKNWYWTYNNLLNDLWQRNETGRQDNPGHQDVKAHSIQVQNDKQTFKKFQILPHLGPIKFHLLSFFFFFLSVEPLILMDKNYLFKSCKENKPSQSKLVQSVVTRLQIRVCPSHSLYIACQATRKRKALS